MMRVRGRSAALGAVMLGAGLGGCAANSTPAPESSALPSEYADGTYEATGWYGSLPSHQDVTLTLEGGVVTAVSLTTPAEDTASLGHQQRFADALGDEIVGFDVDTIDVQRLAGASGCSEGFMSALAEIKTAARSAADEGAP